MTSVVATTNSKTSFSAELKNHAPASGESVEASSEYPLPNSISSAPTDLFDGELGDYELNGTC